MQNSYTRFLHPCLSAFSSHLFHNNFQYCIPLHLRRYEHFQWECPTSGRSSSPSFSRHALSASLLKKLARGFVGKTLVKGFICILRWYFIVYSCCLKEKIQYNINIISVKKTTSMFRKGCMVQWSDYHSISLVDADEFSKIINEE